MVDRRVLIKYGVAFAAAIAGGSRATGAATAGRPALEVALVDGLLAGSASFAAKARVHGLVSLEFSGDAAGIWMRELQPRLRAGPTAIEGYTSAATLFCLELLARDYGAQVVRRRETGDGVAWILSSRPPRRAPLAPLSPRSRKHA